MLSGSPQPVSDIPYNVTEKKYFLELKIMIVAKDITGASGTSNFTLKIENKKPEARPPSLQFQFAQSLGTLLTKTQFMMKFSPQSFVDDDQFLAYSMKQSNLKMIPAWLIFSRETLALSGTPPESALFKTYTLIVEAKDHFQFETQTLKLFVGVSLQHLVILIIQIFGNIIGTDLCQFRASLHLHPFASFLSPSLDACP